MTAGGFYSDLELRELNNFNYFSNVFVRGSDGELKAKFDAVISEMKCDGSLNALIEKWLPGSATF